MKNEEIKENIAPDIKKISWPQSVLINAEYLIGSLIPDPSGKPCEGANNALKEIVENAIDVIYENPNATTLLVDNEHFNGYNAVFDDSWGIPIRMSEISGITMARLSISDLNTGSKFNGEGESKGSLIGRFGVGSGVTNSLSKDYILLSKITKDNYNTSIPAVKELWEKSKNKENLYYVVRYINHGQLDYDGAMTLKQVSSLIGAELPEGFSTLVLFKLGETYVPDPRTTIPVEDLEYFLLIAKEFYKRKVTVIANGKTMTAAELSSKYRFRIKKDIIPEDTSKNKVINLIVYFDVDSELNKKSYVGCLNGLSCTGLHINYVESAFDQAIRANYGITHKYTTNWLKMCVIALAENVGFDTQYKQRVKSLGKVKQSDFSDALVKEFVKIFKKYPDIWDEYAKKLNELAASMKALSVSDKVQKMIEDSHGKAIFKSKSDLIPGFSDATGKDRWECELFLCFTGDTEILTYDNEKISFIDLVKKIENGEEIYTYSCTPNGERRKSKIIAAKKIKKVKHLVKVNLGEYGSFECTPDHKIMMLNGNYKEAKDLIIGDDLMTIDGSVKLLSIYLHWCDDEDVYCLEVDDPEHNFSLAVGGLFAKNCEGLSPAGSLKAGRPDTSKYAILPLRGKIKGTVDSSMEDALENKEIKTIFSVIGLGMGDHNVTSEAKTQEEAFELIRKYSRYGKIIIAVD